MPVDFLTRQFYMQAAAEYAAVPPHGKFVDNRNRFMNLLPLPARILDLGCGGGHDGRAFRDAGFQVTAVDASTEMATFASARIDQKVIVRSFQDLTFTEEFDGVWASASLLHVPSEELPDVLRRVRCSLRRGGLLYASFKEAEKDWRDKGGRLFCAMTPTLLGDYLAGADFTVDAIERHEGHGSDAMATMWILAFARKLT